MLSLLLYVVTFLIIKTSEKAKKNLNAINLTIIKKYKKTPFISVLTVVPAALI